MLKAAWTLYLLGETVHGAWQLVGLVERGLQERRSGPFFTVFLPHGCTMGLQIRQKLVTLGHFFALRVESLTGCQVVDFKGKSPVLIV